MAIVKNKCVADPTDICRLAVELGVSNATAAILLNRGIDSEEIGRQFIGCEDSAINDPFEMLGMYEAVDLINEAIECEKTVTVYGDYDVDGITSTCILFKYLKSLGIKANCYIPNRFTEGYGMNKDAVLKIASNGTDVIIALDCGITSVEEVALAKELGMDVMIVDHHNPPEELPDADVIIDPKQKFCEYPFKGLCSAGLATKIVEAHGGRDAAKQFYDIAAIGTIADVVPLQNENRYYVKKGIEKINKNPCVGVKALKTVAGYGDKAISARGVAFSLAPRLNAAGRLATAKEGLQMFLSDDITKANEFALRLNEYNEERRGIEKQIYDDSAIWLKKVDFSEEKILIVTGEGWNKGVIGIAASRFTEQYNRPTVVISMADDVCTASARSIPGYDIYEGLCTCNDLFTRFGGHSQAAGFSLPRENIPKFIERMRQHAKDNISDDMLIPMIEYEFMLSPSDIDLKTANEILCLEPFGKDNEQPLFCADKLEFVNSTVIGKDRNVLKAALSAGGLTIDCVGFGKADYLDTMACKALKRAVFSVDINVWQGVEKVQLGLKDIKLSLNNEKDIEALIDSMNMNLFDAFDKDYICEKADGDACIDVATVAKAFCEHIIGSLAIVTDEKSLVELITILDKNGEKDNVDIFVGELPKEHEFGANTILLMPYKNGLPKGEFSRIFIPQYFCTDIAGKADNITRYKSDCPYANEKTLSREDFARVYKALHECEYKISTWSNVVDVIDLLFGSAGVKITPFELKLVLGVFSELGFIRYEYVDNMMMIAFEEKITKRQLTDSGLYNKYYNKFIKQQ